MSELVISLMVVGVLSYAGLILAFTGLSLAYGVWTNKRRGFRETLIAWGIPIIIACLCCSAPLTLSSVWDTIELSQLEERLYTYPLPPETQMVNRQSAVTPNPGNDDYCIFTIQQTMQTKLSPSEVVAYYEDVEVPGLSNYPRPVVVMFGGTPTNPNEMRFTIAIGDMRERLFDLGC